MAVRHCCRMAGLSSRYLHRDDGKNDRPNRDSRALPSYRRDCIGIHTAAENSER